MKILLITTHLEFGGISSYTFGLAKTLTAHNHSVWCASAGGALVPQFEKNRITHVRIPIKTKSELNPLLLICYAQLERLIRRESIDIIHAQTRVAQVLAAALSRNTGVPVVTTCHGFFTPNIGRQLFPGWGDKVIAISDAVAKHLMIDFFVPQEKIAMIPNGIDVGAFRVSPKRSDMNHPDRTVGIIARLSPVKGHAYLVEAMAAVIREFPDARLFIFGQGKINIIWSLSRKNLELSTKCCFCRRFPIRPRSCRKSIFS
jgi:Glycosyltransferase